MTSTTTEQTFSQAIRAATVDAHGSAQSSGFMADLFAGRVDRDRYARYAAQNRFIYAAIEQAGARLEEDLAAACFPWPELVRLPSVDADLDFLIGDGWRRGLEMSAGTARYVDRIERASTWSGGFVAHHYVRYMGDLSGGQAIAKFIARQFGFEDDGVRSLAFPEITDLGTFKDEYRRHLDEAPWSEHERALIVEEILAAYDLATAMLQDL